MWTSPPETLDHVHDASACAGDGTSTAGARAIIDTIATSSRLMLKDPNLLGFAGSESVSRANIPETPRLTSGLRPLSQTRAPQRRLCGIQSFPSHRSSRLSIDFHKLWTEKREAVHPDWSVGVGHRWRSRTAKEQNDGPDAWLILGGRTLTRSSPNPSRVSPCPSLDADPSTSHLGP